MLPGDLVIYDALTGNAIPTREEKSAMRRWFERSVLSNVPLRPGDQIKGGLSAFRKTTEALGTGAALAVIHVESEGGLDKFGVPLDGLAGAALTVGSVVFPNSEVSPDARDIGADAITVWSFRKTCDLLVEKRIASGKAVPRHLSPANKIHGEDNAASEDPIINAARAL